MDRRADLQPAIATSVRTGSSDESAALIPCTVCQHEIPPLAAVSREGLDYVEYFCGLECYERWRNQSGAL